MNKSSEFEKFDNAMRDLIKVSHSELKAKLDAEKKAKARKKKRAKASASARASREKG